MHGSQGLMRKQQEEHSDILCQGKVQLDHWGWRRPGRPHINAENTAHATGMGGSRQARGARENFHKK